VWFRRKVRQRCPGARRDGPRAASHIPLNCALRDADAELQELASNPLGSPEPVVGRHAVDEGDNLRRDARFAWTVLAGCPPPEHSESFPVPSQDRLGLDQEQGLAPPAIEAREQHEQASLVDAKGRAFDGARGDDELLPKERVLGDELGAGAGQVGDESARDARRTARLAERPHRPGCTIAQESLANKP